MLFCCAGSTFGGNPLGCAVAEEALRVLVEENMCERATLMGNLLRRTLEELKSKHPEHVCVHKCIVVSYLPQVWLDVLLRRVTEGGVKLKFSCS